MNSPRVPSSLWLTTASVAAMAASAFAQSPQILLRDGAVPRTFDIATDEVVIVQKKGLAKKSHADLKSAVKSQLPGAQILNERTGQVHVKLSSPVDRTRAAAGTAPATKAVPGTDSLPVLYVSGVVKNEFSRRLVSSDLLVRIPE
ncbi:MAG: hypothetical protein EOP84_16960, partial [Verrucomicrobiaceae bacterium]